MRCVHMLTAAYVSRTRAGKFQRWWPLPRATSPPPPPPAAVFKGCAAAALLPPLRLPPRPYSFGEVAGERWLTLLPKKWRGQQIYSWRYDPREVMAFAAAPERDQRRANAVRMEVDA